MIYEHSPQYATNQAEHEAKRKNAARAVAKLERIHNQTRDILNALGADTSGMTQADAFIKEVKEYIGPEYPAGGIVVNAPMDEGGEYVVKRTNFLKLLKGYKQ